MTAMDFRQYDNALGRFNSIDALSEMNYAISPFAFAYNNPIFWSDPTGLLSQTFINSIFNNSSNGTKWVNDGAGNFDKIGSNGYVNQQGEYHEGSGNGEILPEVTLSTKIGDNRNWDRIRGNAYLNGKYYKHWRDKQSSTKWDEFQDSLDWLGSVPGFGEPVDLINAGVSGIRGNYARAGLSLAAMVPIGGALATIVKIQKHHIIPKAVYRDAGKAVQEALELNGGFNLKRLPTPFHGNHPQYNIYVTNQLENLKEVTPGSIKALQKDLNGMINKAYDNYKDTGENLNDYFRQFNLD